MPGNTEQSLRIEEASFLYINAWSVKAFFKSAFRVGGLQTGWPEEFAMKIAQNVAQPILCQN
jgi:hypothetical protein